MLSHSWSHTIKWPCAHSRSQLVSHEKNGRVFMIGHSWSHTDKKARVLIEASHSWFHTKNWPRFLVADQSVDSAHVWTACTLSVC